MGGIKGLPYSIDQSVFGGASLEESFLIDPDFGNNDDLMGSSHFGEFRDLNHLSGDTITGRGKPIGESDRLGTEGSIGRNEDPYVNILIQFAQKGRR